MSNQDIEKELHLKIERIEELKSLNSTLNDEIIYLKEKFNPLEVEKKMHEMTTELEVYRTGMNIALKKIDFLVGELLNLKKSIDIYVK